MSPLPKEEIIKVSLKKLMVKIVLKSFWYKYQERYQAIKSMLCVGLGPEFRRSSGSAKKAMKILFGNLIKPLLNQLLNLLVLISPI